jgi:hypothetical protein
MPSMPEVLRVGCWLTRRGYVWCAARSAEPGSTAQHGLCRMEHACIAQGQGEVCRAEGVWLQCSTLRVERQCSGYAAPL